MALLIQLVKSSCETMEGTENTKLGRLVEFSVLFVESKGLPTHGTNDHRIFLKGGAQPVSTRPYRYPYYQKHKIKKIMG